MDLSISDKHAPHAYLLSRRFIYYMLRLTNRRCGCRHETIAIEARLVENVQRQATAYQLADARYVLRIIIYTTLHDECTS